MNIILFDTEITRLNFLPLSHTRPVAQLKSGILSNSQRWAAFMPQATISHLCASYLSPMYPVQYNNELNVYIASNLKATLTLCQQIKNLKPNTGLSCNGVIIAFATTQQYNYTQLTLPQLNEIEFAEATETPDFLNNLWDIFSKNSQWLKDDFELLTKDKTSQKLSETNTLIGSANNLYIAQGAVIEGSILNTTNGPIYIDEDAEIMEGCLIRGGFYLGKKAQLKMGAKIYGATTIGDGCKVGGEVNNSVFYANSSKAHDGFIGNSVIGEWCNIGADSNNSNLKNNYEEVKLWSEAEGKFVKTGLQFCGLIMADHSKCGINTMFNTGTVVGVSANVFGSGFPRNFIPSYSWGGAAGFQTYMLSKAMATAQKVFERRNLTLSTHETELLSYIFENTKDQRNF